MQPSFGTHVQGSGSVLLCPNCGNTYLHHARVEVFEREREDQPKGLHVSVANATATIDTSLEGNPSSRRDGLSIAFSCEQCAATSTLVIFQHKGQTFVDFDIRSQE